MSVVALVGPALTALGVAGALVAFRQERPWAYGAAKGVASIGFLATALASGTGGEGWTRWVLAALALSGAGDVALAVRSRRGFLGGLALFLVAHATFAFAFAVRGAAALPLVAAGGGVVLALVLGWRAWRARLPGAMLAPVAAYALVLGTMVALALATGVARPAPVLVLGALLVAGSDLAVAREGFVTQGFVNKAVGLPTYYLGQTLVALALVGPGLRSSDDAQVRVPALPLRHEAIRVLRTARPPRVRARVGVEPRP